MTKQEWIEYFQAVNNRMPSIQELQAAVLSGEIVDDIFNQRMQNQTGFNQQTNYYQQHISNNSMRKNKPKFDIPIIICCFIFIIGILYAVFSIGSEEQAYKETIQEASQETSQQVNNSGEYQYLDYNIELISNVSLYENEYRDNVYIMDNTNITQYGMDGCVYIMVMLDNYGIGLLGESYVPPELIVYDNSIDFYVNNEKHTQSGSFYSSGKIFLNIDDLQKMEVDDETGIVCYILAHEAGHHIQNLLTDLDMVKTRQRKMIDKGDLVGANRINIRLELQADYYAGSFCKYLNKVSQDYGYNEYWIDADMISNIINTANNIGDDTLLGEKYSAEISEHGTATQRKRWFWNGYNDENFTKQKIYDLKDEEL